MSPRKLASLLFLGFLLTAFGAQAANIKKCQGDDGKWHYGDNAAEECAKSKITVMNKAGATKGVIAAPLTERELKEREAQRETIEAEQARVREQKRKDSLLLSTYGVEDDITYIRDRKIAQIQSQIKASEETLKSLRASLARMEAQAVDESKDANAAESTSKNIELTRSQIARHEGAVAVKRQEQEALRTQYANELERYRELKRKPSASPSAAAAQK